MMESFDEDWGDGVLGWSFLKTIILLSKTEVVNASDDDTPGPPIDAR